MPSCSHVWGKIILSREVCVSSWHQGRAQLGLGSHSSDSQEWNCKDPETWETQIQLVFFFFWGKRVPSELTYLKLLICPIKIKPQMQWNGLTFFRDITYGSHLQWAFHLYQVGRGMYRSMLWATLWSNYRILSGHPLGTHARRKFHSYPGIWKMDLFLSAVFV